MLFIANEIDKNFFGVIYFPAQWMHKRTLLEFCIYSDCIGSHSMPLMLGSAKNLVKRYIGVFDGYELSTSILEVDNR